MEVTEHASEFNNTRKVFDDMTDAQSQVSRGKSVHSKNTRKVKQATEHKKMKEFISKENNKELCDVFYKCIMGEKSLHELKLE